MMSRCAISPREGGYVMWASRYPAGAHDLTTVLTTWFVSVRDLFIKLEGER